MCWLTTMNQILLNMISLVHSVHTCTYVYEIGCKHSNTEKLYNVTFLKHKQSFLSFSSSTSKSYKPLHCGMVTGKGTSTLKF